MSKVGFKVYEKYIGQQAVEGTYRKNSVIINKETAEVHEELIVVDKGKRKGYPVVDTQPFIKMYDLALDLLPKLKKGELLLLCLILRNIKPHQKFVYIEKQPYMEVMKISMATLEVHIAGLKKHSVIQRTFERDMYEINPNFFYNGSRLKLLMEQQKKEKHTEAVKEKLKTELGNTE